MVVYPSCKSFWFFYVSCPHSMAPDRRVVWFHDREPNLGSQSGAPPHFNCRAIRAGSPCILYLLTGTDGKPHAQAPAKGRPWKLACLRRGAQAGGADSPAQMGPHARGEGLFLTPMSLSLCPRSGRSGAGRTLRR